jgi:hypothetical protein
MLQREASHDDHCSSHVSPSKPQSLPIKNGFDDQSANKDRKEDVRGPTIQRDARRIARVVQGVHLVADRVF